MSTSKAGDVAIYMCKLCNQFSKQRDQLLLHCTQQHQAAELPQDEIIVSLLPLSGPPQEATDSHVKRKRGRPKGSTKKSCSDKLVVDLNSAPPAQEQNEAVEEKDKSLDCKRCNRKFSNRRQILKHICLMALKDEEEEEEEEEEHCERDSEGGPSAEEKDEARARSSKRARTLCSEKCSSMKQPERVGTPCKNPIINVVLTAHEALPGATKIVPIEATPAEAGPLADAASQTMAAGPQATGSQASALQASTPMEAALQAEGPRRGFQEYAIQQDTYQEPLKPCRSVQTQLKIFTCEYCNKVFKFRHSLQAHLRIHTKEKPFQCPHCDYASAIKANLCVHMRKHTGEKFSCGHCSFSCLSRGQLRVHVERVHQRIKQHCPFCKKKYSDIKNLLKHVRQKHNMEDAKVKEAYDQLRLQTREGKRQLLYHCSTCQRKFKNQLERDRHMLVHGTQRPFSCELCDHGCTKLPVLQAHVRKHPFIYVCSSCQKKFISSMRLKAHLQEAHPDWDEAEAFPECISSSFCLLEPGDDLRREMLKQDELRIAQELAQLNVPGEEGAEGGEEVTEEKGFERCRKEEGREQLTKDKGAGSCRKEEEEGLEELTEEKGEVRCSEKEVGVGRAKPECVRPSAETSMSDQATDSPDHLEPAETTQEVIRVETVDRSPSMQRKCPAEKVEMPAHAPAEGLSAFQQIVDKMQKRRLCMALFERIRRVYGDLECEYCGKLFWYQVHFNMHVRTHTKEHLHYCSQCNYSSITKNSLQRHMVQRHSNVLLRCPAVACTYNTPDKYKLQAHIKTHSDQEKKTFPCPACEQRFTEDRLRYHIKTSHPETPMSALTAVLGVRVQVKGKIGTRPSKCPYCDSYFIRNGTDLQQHIWAHEGVKPFKCSLCDYASRSKSNLKAHMNRHSTEKSHLCDTCGKKFKSKVTLRSHRLMHSDEGKQYKCTECDYTAAYKPGLLRHMEQHASFKPFRCAHCHYSCNIAGPLKRHYSRKHPEEEYHNAGPGGTAIPEAVEQQGGVNCPVCEFAYGTRWEMNRHLKNKHGLRLVENDGAGVTHWEVVESVEEPTAQYLQVTEADEVQEDQGVETTQEVQTTERTETAAAALQGLRFTENGVVTSAEGLEPSTMNILQQIIELGSESHEASMVAMAPGTVTVVEQVAEESSVGNHSDQAVLIQEAFQRAVGLGEQHHLVVASDNLEGIETVTVYTQGDNANQFIVYVQEALQTQEQTVETD
ncbi:zinc finger protein ZFAT-like [Osmerus eperlanus]|uniref:zinc finger protein ZFAT-like n=1 Tax=Osmerus eperlanus TaxID=29151 RepID=UPI002E159A7A